MKKIIFIAFAAILAGFAISCQKEAPLSENTTDVQYTFNITVNNQVGFDSEASTKGGSSEKYKTGWENKDKIFLFFKPTDGSLLADTYATLTYNGSSWDGAVTGTTSLGEEGTLSAVYVYNLGDVTPNFSTDKWTIATGNTFYNCHTTFYTVSGNVISASLNLVAPADFVRFYVTNATGALTCDKVKGWKDIAIGSDLAVSNVTCTGYMDGYTNTGDSNVKEYYGRIINDGTSLNGEVCEFSTVKNGTVYERTATPSSDARSFKMNTSATGDLAWTEAPGKLPGLFTISKGADDKAGTADDVLVRFSQGNLVATIDATGAPTAWKFAANQYDYIGNATANTTIGSTAGDVDLFGWSTASTTYGISTSTSSSSYSGDFVDWGKAYCEKNSITPDNTWRTLSKAEWTYLSSTRTASKVSGEENARFAKATVNSKAGVILLPDTYTHPEGVTPLTKINKKTVAFTYNSYDSANWAKMESAGAVFLPAAGERNGSDVTDANSRGSYWSSSLQSSDNSYRVLFHGSDFFPGISSTGRNGGFSVRLVTEVK